MSETIDFRLNGKPVLVVTDPDRLLLWVLRTERTLTETKCGCGIGLACGLDAGTYVALMAEIEADKKTSEIKAKRILRAQRRAVADPSNVEHPHPGRYQCQRNSAATGK